MKKVLLLLILIVVFLSGCTQGDSNTPINTINAAEIELTSPAFQHNGEIPSKYTCDGQNLIPPLNYGEIPDETKSLTLIMDDPDALGGTFDHWVVFNIDPVIRRNEEGSEPYGIDGYNSAEEVGYIGPCPQSGEHRYIFKLYALDTELNLEEGATKQDIEQAMKNHVIGLGRLVGRYSNA